MISHLSVGGKKQPASHSKFHQELSRAHLELLLRLIIVKQKQDTLQPMSFFASPARIFKREKRPMDVSITISGVNITQDGE